jgi:hypothetical protein
MAIGVAVDVDPRHVGCDRRLAPSRHAIAIDHAIANDLTPTANGRNVDAFVRGNQSPPSTFGPRPAWRCIALVAPRARAGSAQITGTVEEGRSQHETAQDGWRQLVATAASDRRSTAV